MAKQQVWGTARRQVVAALGGTALATVLAGCQTMPMQAGAGYPDYYYAGVAPVAAQQPPALGVAQVQALENVALQLKDRLERLEKAMLRLDRRMQLVERNELTRMSAPNATLTPADERAARRSLDLDGMPAYQPVSSGSGAIVGALQAAPRPLQALAEAPEVGGGLPSLADPEPAAGRAPGMATQVASWVVRYGPEDEVWPARDELVGSRGVVQALRENPRNTTVFARGTNPNGKQFRERVKALSRYLAKVTSLETVPIATLAGPQLDGDTIELFATH